LDRYICAEELSGDNQYWCETCQTKRDAQRTIWFQELPPLLNVQISRYVFDREKLVKKKLMDKVCLPQILTVPLKGKKSDSKYLLCAVMKHHGTSAYQGHYVAEAMDWHCGTWFEFNDEKVRVLDGPGCSYAPHELNGTDTNKKLKGSQDAYNMYYVEESFLAKCAAGFHQGEGEQTLNGTDKASVIAKVANERERRYAMLTK
jgi:ubiquitin carboxyl-terminal hydrolase 48